VLLIILQAGFFFCFGTVTLTMASDGSEASPETSRFAFGAGSPVVINTEGPKWSLDVRWSVLLLNLAACYVLSLILAGAAARVTELRRPALVYLAATAAVCLIAFLGSIIISRSYWGYYFRRPPLLPEANGIREVKAVIPVKTKKHDSGECFMTVDNDFSLVERMSYAEDDPYGCLEERILLDLKRKNLLPRGCSLDLGDLSGMYQLIASSGVLATSEKGYSSSDNLWGVVVDGLDGAGGRLLFVGLMGAEVSNDHHPYYELIFRESAGKNGWTFLRGQRFFYDVAGIEGLEWYAIWPMLSLLGIVVGLPTLAIILGTRGIIRKRRRPQPSVLSGGVEEPLNRDGHVR
jgi:hypothetical protein